VYESLRDDNEYLRHENESLIDMNELLNDENESLKSEVKSLSSEIETLKDENELLRKENQETKIVIMTNKSLEKEIISLKERFNKMKTDFFKEMEKKDKTIENMSLQEANVGNLFFLMPDRDIQKSLVASFSYLIPRAAT
jgi:hypothetical protein